MAQLLPGKPKFPLPHEKQREFWLYRQAAADYSLLLVLDFFFSSLAAFFSLGDLAGSFFFSLRASCAFAMV
ncbi:hypothetical protein [Hymenobacter aquaticus]|uniref:hypothetical protein n=1 Tax=Hymenobacter aquaticus TaxID=1867101 RepID=UPI0014368262|nr:hypothetical protein [Hymenobacter aquaticus]